MPFLIILLLAIASVEIMLQRGNAKGGVVAIVFTLPFLFLFGLPLLEDELPSGSEGILRVFIKLLNILEYHLR